MGTWEAKKLKATPQSAPADHQWSSKWSLAVKSLSYIKHLLMKILLSNQKHHMKLSPASHAQRKIKDKKKSNWIGRLSSLN